MIKVLVGVFGLLFAMVIGFTFMPTNVDMKTLVSDYNNTVVYSKNIRVTKDSITPTQDDAVQNHVQSVVTQKSPAGNPLMLHFPVKTGPDGKGVHYTSGYGPRNVSKYKHHSGLDFARLNRIGSNFPIVSATEGTVTHAGKSTGAASNYGNYVKVTDPRTGLEYRYAHMSSVSVKTGDTVSYGQQLGIMGETGGAKGVHLHFEIHTPTVKPGILPSGIKKHSNTVDPADPAFVYDESTKPNKYEVKTGSGWVESYMQIPVFGSPSSGPSKPAPGEPVSND